jgi:hypothetical protein
MEDLQMREEHWVIVDLVAKESTSGPFLKDGCGEIGQGIGVDQNGGTRHCLATGGARE